MNRPENVSHPVGPDHRRLHLDVTYAGDVMLQEHGSGSEHMVKHVKAIEAEAVARALARVAEAVRRLPVEDHPLGWDDGKVPRADVLALLTRADQ